MHEIPIYENQIICNLRYKTINKVFKAIKNIITHPNQSSNHLSKTNIWILQSQIIMIYFTKYSSKIHSNGKGICFYFQFPIMKLSKFIQFAIQLVKEALNPVLIMQEILQIANIIMLADLLLEGTLMKIGKSQHSMVNTSFHRTMIILRKTTT